MKIDLKEGVRLTSTGKNNLLILMYFISHSSSIE